MSVFHSETSNTGRSGSGPGWACLRSSHLGYFMSLRWESLLL